VQPFKGRFVDPNRVNLRKAARAAIVVPFVFAVLVVTDDAPSALFAAFGSFSALVFADFGGPLPRRFRAYVVLAVVGGLLVALGTAFADTIWPAVVVTLLVAFVIAMSGALGGYFTASGTAATLAYVLAVMSPGVEADLAARELGWLAGVLVAGVTAVVLWPVHQRDRARLAAVAMLREAADAMSTAAASRDLSGLERAADALDRSTGIVYRPAGSITRERALVQFVVVTRRLRILLNVVTRAEATPVADPSPEYAALSARVAELLVDSAAVAAGDVDTAAEVSAVVEARQAHTDAIERWATTTLGERDGGDRVVDRISATFPLRRLSLAAIDIADATSSVVHDEVRTRDAGMSALRDAWATLGPHLHVRSVRFRNAARAGLGLALAVLVAKTSSVQHAFWVVLAALSVLRSNALGTGATALQALTGALIGFGVGSLVIVTIGGDDTGLWIVLPLVTFLAAYTPGAVNFVVGQAGFTVFVVVLFDILVPAGWRTGLVRVQDIAIGAGISVAVGAILWPRGARGVARRSFADLLERAAQHVRLALDVTLRDHEADLDAAGRRVADARARAVAALEDLALEHGGGLVDRQGWTLLLQEALVLELAADGIVRAGRGWSTASVCGGASNALLAEGQAVAVAVDEEAEQLVRQGIRALGSIQPASLPVPAELHECLAHRGPAAPQRALGLVWVHEWLALVAEHRR
jgi:uncharacterized membrane protein YccC